MRTNDRTASERWFERYLAQRGLLFRREPFGDRARKPDYLFRKSGKSILVEVKEVHETPLTRELGVDVGPTGARAESLDPTEKYRVIRERIREACRQLKPYQDRVDHAVILLGLVSPLDDFTEQDLLYAMYGDPVIRMPVNRSTGIADVSRASADMRVNGQLRKNRPDGVMYSPHSNYLSGVGVIERFNAQSYYHRKYLEGLRPRTKDPVTFLRHIQKLWAHRRLRLPLVYRHHGRVLYRITLVSNVLGKRPLPPGIFNGRWDKVVEPEVRPGRPSGSEAARASNEDRKRISPPSE